LLLQFHKRSQLFNGPRNETLSVAAMPIGDEIEPVAI
jgi:hypothetical protein